MSTPAFAFVAAAALLAFGVSGCAQGPGYVVHATSREAVPEKLDAHWFTRDIFDGQGLKYVELTYCPVQAGEVAPVCRTSVIWTRGRTELFPTK